ncbi:CDGSH iron-sulfur domain-containing protein [Kineococcus sp. SYSU DK004]|uniref:CDGSH iron-sulfur domain-containing protein n=1 Tax=Kineococcus sp. SYSU DK004 TaxID=3383125 RepID=UPI003D7D3688
MTDTRADGLRDAAPTDDGRELPPTPSPEVTITVCPDGPLLVRGPAEVVDADGAAVPRDRRTIALCRCGRTGRAPFCDGTHKVQPRGRS